MKDLYNKLLQNTEPRQTLSSIRKAIKEPQANHIARDLFSSNPQSLEVLLGSEDAKTRKNCALLIGELGLNQLTESLFNSYLHETTLFVRASYLEALSRLDSSSYTDRFKERLDLLGKMNISENDKKHINEETGWLTRLIISEEGISTHSFTGYGRSHECILLTNKLHKDITEASITDGELLPFPSGIRVRTDSLEDILAIRTYKELLFAIPGLRSIPADPVKASQAIADSPLLTLLKADHRESGPFYFRLEIKTKLPLDKKAVLAKRLSGEIEAATGRVLINSTSSYEVELRLIENKNGGYNILYKLFTIPDTRFSYRAEAVAESIKPEDAALLVMLARDYMADNAQVIDPFCGVGTMLIERQMMVKANTSYGLDINSGTIEKAKQNTENAGQIIHYINRDFFTFTHEYKFDEIFTNMPFNVYADHVDTESIYQHFFKYAGTILAENGTIILYSHDPELAAKYAASEGWKIYRDIEVMHKTGTRLFILGR